MILLNYSPYGFVFNLYGAVFILKVASPSVKGLLCWTTLKLVEQAPEQCAPCVTCRSLMSAFSTKQTHKQRSKSDIVCSPPVATQQSTNFSPPDNPHSNGRSWPRPLSRPWPIFTSFQSINCRLFLFTPLSCFHFFSPVTFFFLILFRTVLFCWENI